MVLSKRQFIETLAPQATRARNEGSPLFSSVRLAQNLLETGGVIHSWNNLGGIKVGNGKPNEWWDGASVNKGTWEVYDGKRLDTTASFRAYKSIYHFYKDQDCLFANDRYARVRTAKTPMEQAELLRLCGYATDPKYGSKLIAIMDTYDLRKYDEINTPSAENEIKLNVNPKMNVTDAEKVISYLSTAWKAANASDKPEIHRLADEVRKVAGITITKS